MTNTTSKLSLSRIDLVDGLRGFVIMAILLLHNIEHFDFYYFVEDNPAWLKAIDSVVWDTLFFLFGGKAYGIFALLFGFTFYLQLNRRGDETKSFAPVFLRRLFILFLFGMINSIFYEGDILAFYAIFGIALLPVSKLNNTAVLVIAAILLLQPVELINIIRSLSSGDYFVQEKLSTAYFREAGKYLAGESFLDLAKGNLINGRISVILWSWENGRFFQTPALFMLGMVLGRQQRFVLNERNIKFWSSVLMISALLFIPLYLLKENIDAITNTKPLAEMLQNFVTIWANLAFMFLLVAAFILMYNLPKINGILATLNPLGRMSLTNYIIQSIIGSFIYYGYGLGLYKYTGATHSLLIGLIMFALQLQFCKWWLKTHKQGPFEYLWRRATQK